MDMVGTNVKKVSFTMVAVLLLLWGVQALALSSAADLKAQADAMLQQLQGLEQRVDKLTITHDLRFGMRANAEVRRLQQFLVAKGYLSSDLATGNFFTRTRLAVKKFQANNGLPSTGYVGPLTRQVITKLSQSTTTSTSQERLPGTTIVQKPSSTPAVPGTPSTTPPPPFHVDARPLYDLPSLARLIQNVINDVRSQNNLGTLLWGDDLALMATMHSQDQANDNGAITNPQLLCNYPLIRHEGFAFGYSLKDRFDHQGISYMLAGENIAMIPVSKNLVYQYSSDNPPPKCPEVPDFTPGEGTQEQRTQLYQSVLSQSRAAVATLKPVECVNREWLTPEQIADRKSVV